MSSRELKPPCTFRPTQALTHDPPIVRIATLTTPNHRSSAGRVVNVASMSGHLSIMKNQSRKDAFTDPSLTK